MSGIVSISTGDEGDLQSAVANVGPVSTYMDASHSSFQVSHFRKTHYKYLQWNLSNPDTNGAEESVIVSEVSSFQRLKCMQEWYLGWKRCPV